MSRIQVAAAFLAVGIHGVILLFGGLLIPHVQEGGPRIEEVDLIGETEAEEEKKPEEKEKTEEQQAALTIVNGFIEPFTKELPLEYSVELNRLIQLEMSGSVG